MAPMTPLNNDLTERRARIVQDRPARRRGPIGAARPPANRPDRLEIWQAVSADGLWLYDRTETESTPWVTTYQPTGQDTYFGNLPEARRWTATPLALQQLRARAHDVISRAGRSGAVVLAAGPAGSVQRVTEKPDAAAARLALAMRAAAILDGTLAWENAPTARCHQAGPLAVCGGFLVCTDTGWVHVDTCNECVGLMLDECRGCFNLAKHQACGDPDPVLCEHAGCSAPADLVQMCPRERDACCQSCCYVVCGGDR